MVSILKLVLLTAAARLAMAAAFVSSGSHSTAYRSTAAAAAAAAPPAVPPPRSPFLSSSTTTTRLDMSTAAPAAPAKKRERKEDADVDTRDESDRDRGWLVRLYNDPMNKREFVAKCLTEITGLGDGEAYGVMMRAHQTGIAVIGNYHRELAELHKARLSGEGLFVDMVPADDD